MEVDMQRPGRRKRSFGILLSIFLFCWGCAAPAPAPKSPVAQVPQSAQSSGPERSGSTQPRAVRVQGMRVQEGQNDLVLFVTGDAPFVDYEIQRLGEDQFLLQLKDIGSLSDLPPNMPVSDRLSLACGPMESGRGVEIIGTTKGHLDRYTMTASGNDLVLAILTNEAETAPPAVSSARSVVPKTAVKKSKVMPASAVAAPARPIKSHVPEPTSTATTVGGSSPMVAGQQGKAASPGGPSTGRYIGKPISLDLVDADLRNVLRLISEVTGTNIAIEPDVNGKVTLKVEQVPWDQVLEMVLAMNNLGQEQQGNVIRVARLEKLKQEMNVKADEIKAKQELSEVYRDVGDFITVYFPINYALPSDIVARMNDLKSDRGKITFDDKTRLIIYSDFLSRIENARTLVSKLDRQTAQVLIEARIVTMTTSLARTLGGKFNMSIKQHSSTDTLRQDWALNSLSTSTFTMGLSEVFGKTLVSLDLTLAAYEDTDELNIVAAPKVVTLDNVSATITQGTQIPYLQLNETGTVASTAFVNAVVELQVKPHITPDGKVRLEIQAKQDEATTVTYTVNQQPGIETRKINTEMMVDDGNIVMIGGVLRNRDSFSEQRTPGLYKIPLIGSLFKYDSIQKEKTELVIFICPKIVESTKAM